MTAAVRPDDIDHPEIADFAARALGIAKIRDAVDELSDLANDLELDAAGIDLDDADDGDLSDSSLSTALDILNETDQRLDTLLEADLIRWLEKDPEHWGIFRMLVIDPWQTEPGMWQEDVPYWIVVLGGNGAIAHFYFDIYGRRVPWSLPIDGDDEPEE